MRTFTEARDWARFHDPKSLALALVGEVGELAELLQWLQHDEQATAVREQPLNGRLAEEMSDVLLYLLRLADVVGVDLAQAAADKLEANERRFPPVCPSERGASQGVGAPIRSVTPRRRGRARIVGRPARTASA
ncbi:nucleotide pyrophosphohydrolase [Geodermatophilus marinus]|nr:nucleotide pyrophosphohydrolase [Geodermatophilus sp. LHW52908]